MLPANAARSASWQIIGSPNSGPGANELHAVAAVSDNDVWAVGTSFTSDSSSSRTLIEHWNGTRWALVKSPSPGTSFNSLGSVAAVSANDVWAVGLSANGTNYSTLVEHWNGAVWSVVPSPNGSDRLPLLNSLSSIAAVSADDIWAVGGFTNDEDKTLTLHWDGTAWSVVPSPNLGPEVDDGLTGVAVVDTNDVWAVGTSKSGATGETRTFTLNWNGSLWNIVPSANDGTNGNSLTAVAAIDSNDVWAVGRVQNIDTLALHWDGLNWSVVATPIIPDNSFSVLSGVVALASGNVWTVGQFLQSSHSRARTLTELWNGSSWSVVTSPNKGAQHNFLNGVGRTPSDTLWAVGAQFTPAFVERTLIVRKTP